MPVIDVRNTPIVVEFPPENQVVEFTEEMVTAEVVVGPTVVEFSWGELIPEPGLSGGGVFEGRVYIRPDIPTLPTNSEPVDPAADYIMLWDASSDTHVKVLAALGGGGGGTDIEFATRIETDEGILLDKALNPDVGAYAYDRKRWPAQHEAGKGTSVFTVVPIGITFTVDCQESNVFDINFAANSVIANPINPLLGQTINVFLKQDGVGGRTATFGDKWTFFNGTPILSTAPGAVDMLSCQYDDIADKWRCTCLTGFSTTAGSGVPYTLANVGGGVEVYKGTVDNLGTDTSQLRTLEGTAGVSVTQVGDKIVFAMSPRIYVQATAPISPQLNDVWLW